MATPTYKAIAFIADEGDWTVARVAERLEALRGVPALRVEVAADNELSASFGGWQLRILVDHGGYVPAEAREVAETYPDYRNAPAVARCRRMAPVWSSDPDPEGNHFDDYLLVVETLIDSFRGVYALDDASGQWFDEGRA